MSTDYSRITGVKKCAPNHPVFMSCYVDVDYERALVKAHGRKEKGTGRTKKES